MKRCSPLHVSPRNHTCPRLRRGASAAAAGALLCAFAGCVIAPGEPADPGEPGEPRKVRTSFAVEVAAGEQPYGVFLSLDESPAERGRFAGTMAINGETAILALRTVELTSVEATMEDGELRVAGRGLSTSTGFTFSWDILELRLQDEDGDGVLQSGTGHIVGQVFHPSGFQDDFTAAPDGYPVMARVYRGSATADDMLPWDSLVVELGQPVSAGESERYRVLADGEEVAGTFEFQEEDGLHTVFFFTPDDFLPLGADIEVDLDGVQNFIGAPVLLQQVPLQVMADPGALSTNLGFEQALAGWYTTGDVGVLASAGDVVPVEGASMAALRTAPDAGNPVRDSALIGYLDVPGDATGLDLSLALLAPADVLPESIVVRLHRALPEGGREEIEAYAFDHEAAVFEPCDCSDLVSNPPLTRRAGPFRHEIDLSALRGQRVFLEIQLHGTPGSGPRPLAVAPIPPPAPPVPSVLLVDDLQIR
jgi:hypothetical protein